MFDLHFIKTGIINENIGEFYSDLFEMRQNADYEDQVEYEKENVLPLLPKAVELINRVIAVLSAT
jgi:uncharacterized protein (UPF0332 family)